MGPVFDDVRHVLLSLLFVISFGWMAALVLPGTGEAGAGQQVALAVTPVAGVSTP